jgi:hypothetical protein
MQTLEIKVHRVEGKRILVSGKTVIVQCVDGNEYEKTFKTERDAIEAITLVAIIPSVWRKREGV